MRFMFCKAWPEAPLTKLSITLTMMALPSNLSGYTPMRQWLLPRTCLGKDVTTPKSVRSVHPPHPESARERERERGREREGEGGIEDTAYLVCGISPSGITCTKVSDWNRESKAFLRSAAVTPGAVLT